MDLKEDFLETVVSRTKGKSCVIGEKHSFVVIGEKINPTGKKKLAEELSGGDFSRVQRFAVSQANAGAHVIDVNVGVPGIDEVMSLSQAVGIVMNAVDLPVSVDSANPDAIHAALEVYEGKAIVNSVTGEERSLNTILPIVKEHNASVIGLAYDEQGPTNDPSQRLEVIKKILNTTQAYGIPQEDVLIDCLARPVSIEDDAALCTLQTIKLVKEELGVNMVLGISNVSFGLPNRTFLNAEFLAMAIAFGLGCAILDPTVLEMKRTLLASELLSGKDKFAKKWIEHYRAHKV